MKTKEIIPTLKHCVDVAEFEFALSKKDKRFLIKWLNRLVRKPKTQGGSNYEKR